MKNLAKIMVSLAALTLLQSPAFGMKKRKNNETNNKLQQKKKKKLTPKIPKQVIEDFDNKQMKKTKKLSLLSFQNPNDCSSSSNTNNTSQENLTLPNSSSSHTIDFSQFTSQKDNNDHEKKQRLKKLLKEKRKREKQEKEKRKLSQETTKMLKKLETSHEELEIKEQFLTIEILITHLEKLVTLNLTDLADTIITNNVFLLSIKSYIHWKTSKTKNIDTCPICSESLDIDSCILHSVQVSENTINHTFHYDCIKGWFDRTIARCPTCNQENLTLPQAPAKRGLKDIVLLLKNIFGKIITAYIIGDINPTSYTLKELVIKKYETLVCLFIILGNQYDEQALLKVLVEKNMDKALALLLSSKMISLNENEAKAVIEAAIKSNNINVISPILNAFASLLESCEANIDIIKNAISSNNPKIVALTIKASQINVGSLNKLFILKTIQNIIDAAFASKNPQIVMATFESLPEEDIKKFIDRYYRTMLSSALNTYQLGIIAYILKIIPIELIKKLHNYYTIVILKSAVQTENTEIITLVFNALAENIKELTNYYTGDILKTAVQTKNTEVISKTFSVLSENIKKTDSYYRYDILKEAIETANEGVITTVLNQQGNTLLENDAFFERRILGETLKTQNREVIKLITKTFTKSESFLLLKKALEFCPRILYLLEKDFSNLNDLHKLVDEDSNNPKIITQTCNLLLLTCLENEVEASIIIQLLGRIRALHCFNKAYDIDPIVAKRIIICLSMESENLNKAKEHLKRLFSSQEIDTIIEEHQKLTSNDPSIKNLIAQVLDEIINLLDEIINHFTSKK